MQSVAQKTTKIKGGATVFKGWGFKKIFRKYSESVTANVDKSGNRLILNINMVPAP